MRGIKDIIDELHNHPDMVHYQIYTKDDIIDDLKFKYSLDLNIEKSEIKLDKSDISDNEWEMVSCEIEQHYLIFEENYGLPISIDDDSDDLKDLEVRLKRIVILNHL